MVKIYSRFQTKTAQNPYPLEWHILYLYSLYREVPSLGRYIDYIYIDIKVNIPSSSVVVFITELLGPEPTLLVANTLI